MRSMRPIRSLLVYFVFVFLGGALLAPLLFWLTQGAAAHCPAFSRLAAQPFHRYVDRSLLGLAVIGLWPLLVSCGMKGLADLGLKGRKRPVKDIVCGFFVGFVSLAIVALFSVLKETKNLQTHFSSAQLLQHLLNATLAAVIVAVLEEIIFRGALFGILRKAMPWPAALVFSSAIYAWVHFLKKADAPPPAHWFSGLEALGQMCAHAQPLRPAFLTLFSAGAILALAYQRTGSLFFSMGLHAGWIFWLKSYQFFTPDNPLDSWLAFVILLLIFGFCARRFPLPP
jgi:CAAX protease family protein